MAWQKHGLSQLIEQLPVGVAVTLPDGAIRYANPCLARLLGLGQSQLVGRGLMEFRRASPTDLGLKLRGSLLAGQVWQEESQLRAQNGETYYFSEWAYTLRDEAGTITHFVHFLQDVSAIRHTEALYRLAFYDVVTGLPNRNLFNDRLARAIAAAERRGGGFALLYIDIDHFKGINDTLGHDAGDELLRQLAQCLVKSLRKSDTVARWGGDEFLAIIEDIADVRIAATMVEKVLVACGGNYDLAGERRDVTLSIGISMYPRDAIEASLLLKYADAAMYQAKSAGRGGYHFIKQVAANCYRAA